MITFLLPTVYNRVELFLHCYSVYIDVLFDRLKYSNVGCQIGHYYVGCIGYADDVCHMAPSCNARRIMF